VLELPVIRITTRPQAIWIGRAGIGQDVLVPDGGDHHIVGTAMDRKAHPPGMRELSPKLESRCWFENKVGALIAGIGFDQREIPRIAPEAGGSSRCGGNECGTNGHRTRNSQSLVSAKRSSK